MKTWGCAFRKKHISSMFNRSMEIPMTAPVGSLSLDLFGNREEVAIIASRYTKGNGSASRLSSRAMASHGPRVRHKAQMATTSSRG